MTHLDRDPKTISSQDRALLCAPVFIVGSGRSGTTWLQRLLTEFDGVISGQESHFFFMFNQAFEDVETQAATPRKTGLSCYWKIDEFYTEMQQVWMKTFSPLLQQSNNPQLLVEKTPGHALYISRIAKFLPKSRFIHVIRDSRAVSASLIAASKNWGSNWAAGSAKSSATEWWRMVTAARNPALRQDPSRYLEVHYEDLHKDTGKELKKVLDFTGIKYPETALEAAVESQRFAKQKKSGGTNIADVRGTILREPDGFFRKGEIDSWKKDLSFIQKLIIWRYTRRLMRECGYSWDGRV
ncbi:sulfotransferase family protein [Desulfogranum mediterraneum]|uniref:sulfotransferase family protein n=1 Tax=Desulfogranum mediterraneum TaxID=160661 RepID=UPI0003F67209|nr:sulfotransferase [Desulfogranum mediterraneum]